MNHTKLIKDLVKCVEQLMPGAGATAVDVGLLNDTLIASDRFLKNPDEDWEHAGSVGVDAGLIMIGDPCYARTVVEEDWSQFCDWFFAEEGNDQYASKDFPLGHEGAGVVMSSGFGDGFYPVYVRKVETGDEDRSDIRIAEARIIFFEDEEKLK